MYGFSIIRRLDWSSYFKDNNYLKFGIYRFINNNHPKYHLNRDYYIEDSKLDKSNNELLIYLNENKNLINKFEDSNLDINNCGNLLFLKIL